MVVDSVRIKHLFVCTRWGLLTIQFWLRYLCGAVVLTHRGLHDEQNVRDGLCMHNYFVFQWLSIAEVSHNFNRIHSTQSNKILYRTFHFRVLPFRTYICIILTQTERTRNLITYARWFLMKFVYEFLIFLHLVVIWFWVVATGIESKCGKIFLEIFQQVKS